MSMQAILLIAECLDAKTMADVSELYMVILAGKGKECTINGLKALIKNILQWITIRKR
jgi:hypothetical protein